MTKNYFGFANNVKNSFVVFATATFLVSGFFVTAPLAFAQAAPCSTGVGSPLIVDATQNITNDVDSGNSGGNWALDNYTRHIQVWLDADGTTYCDRVDYNGTFHAPAGVLSPQNGQPITNDISGTMVGGYTQVVTGVTTTSPIIPSSLDYGGTLANISSWTQSLLPKAYNGNKSAKWQDEVFATGYSASFTNAGNGWSWTYTSNDAHAVWINAGTGSSGDIGPVVNSNSGTTYFTIQAAIDAANPSDTIVLGTDTTVTTQVNVINKAVTIDGSSHTLHANFTKTSNSNNAAIGITHNDVTIKNLVIDGTSGTNLHGVNIYLANNVALNNVTISNNSNGAAVIVNGSSVTATNLNTNNNKWGAVNVDPGVGVITPSIFTLNSGALAESKQIWSDGANVSNTATVNVTASGYTMYKVAGTTAYFVWANKPIANAVTITSGGVSTVYSKIQDAITAASSNDTINVGAGTYAENLVISKALTLAGSGQSSTTIYPAVSNPTGANNVITIQSDNVNLHDFTIDGDNPALTGGTTIGGANVDANRGIMTDPTQNHTNIDVHDVTVKNIYLRGIQLGVSGKTPSFTFSITHDTVQNVQGDPNSSVAIFNAGGSGVISNNNVSGTPDAINANHSRGTQFLANIVTNSASGIHTDNAGDSGGTPDLIQGNQISNGVGDGLTGYTVTGSFGIWLLAPYQQVTVDNNIITNVKNGLAVFGQDAAVNTLFTNNHLDLSNITNSRGAFVTTDQIGFGTQNVSASLTGNTIINSAIGFYVESPGGKTATVVAHSNALTGYTTAYNNASSTTQDATNNWWGNVNPIFGSIVSGTVNYTPWYTNSTAPHTVSTEKVMTSFNLASPSIAGVVNNTAHTITLTVPHGTNVTALTPTIATSTGATVSPASGSPHDLTSPVTYTVASADGSVTQPYVVTVTILASTQTAPDSSTGAATSDSTTPEVVVTNPDKDVDVTISNGTTNPTIDVSKFIDGGTGDIPKITINSNNAGNATISIPATKVTSTDVTWNGVIAAPTVTTITLPVNTGEVKTLSAAIELGFASAKLTFDNAVRILLPNQAGKKAGYSRPGTAFTEITNICAADDQATGNALAADSECKKDVGSDLVIWTKHFTTFATYTLVTYGGGGGGGGGGIATASSTPMPTLSEAAQKVDANKDGKIDILDFNALMVHWGETTANNIADFNKDNKVDIFDFNLLMVNWSI